MTTTLWILTGVFFTTILLYIIALLKKIPLMGKIASGFMLPNLETVSIILLLRSLPDSFHILVITSIALYMASIAEILFLFTEVKVLRILSRITFLISQLFWFDIFKSTFFINRIPSWLSIITVVFYTLILAGTLFICGKQILSKYISYILAMIISFSVNFCTFITLCFERNLHSILQFSGTLASCALIIFYIANHTKFDFKYKNSILLILLIVSQGLISSGNILMIR